MPTFIFANGITGIDLNEEEREKIINRFDPKIADYVRKNIEPKPKKKKKLIIVE